MCDEDAMARHGLCLSSEKNVVFIESLKSDLFSQRNPYSFLILLLSVFLYF